MRKVGKVKTSAKRGFTLIEVMIFLAITGLLLVGALGGTYTSIANQRYNDSVRGFAEFFRQLYSEVISPESLGAGNSNDEAIYGKAVVFGLETPPGTPDDDRDHTVYTVTLVGDVEIPDSSDTFVEELKKVNAHFFCGINNGSDYQDSTVSRYTPLWGTKVRTTNLQPFRGTVIIARSPTSGMVHTAFTSDTFDIKSECTPDDDYASTAFKNYLINMTNQFSSRTEIDFCLESDNSRIIRDVRLGEGGRNTSAVSIIEDNPGETRCFR